MLLQKSCVNKIEKNDLLLQTNKKNIISFSEFENIIDKNIEFSITFRV